MTAISSQGKVVGDLHLLDTSLGLYHFESCQHILLRNVKMTADCDSYQGIVYTEAARHIDFHIEIQKT